MKKRSDAAGLFLLSVLLLIAAGNLAAQNPTLPKGAANQNKLPAPVKPLVKKDSVRYVAVPPTAQVNTRIATADELFMQTGSFALRIANDYRYLTLYSSTPAEGDKPVIWEYVSNPGQNLWKLVPQAGGFYKIQTQSGLFLEVSYFERDRLYELKTFQGNNRRYPDNQLWRIEFLSGGLYKITSKTGFVLSLFNSSPKRDGQDLSVVNRTDARYEQRWHLIKITGDRRQMTSFSPERNGFRFVNTFNGEDFIRWGGLCGGMVYAALDYFHKGVPLPAQSYTPANATTLQSYIYQRQQHSMWNVHEKWSELEVNPFGSRSAEFFRWGIQGFGGGRLEELRNEIDRGRPVPLGLFTGGVGSINGSSTGNHVVLAVGYSLGRYTGDFNGHPEDMKIFVYDPNQRNRMITLVPNMAEGTFFEVEKGKAWRTYFVNHEHDLDHTPPVIPGFPELEPEGNIRHIYAYFKTGGDDLRGGNDNVSITVQYADGTSQVFANVNNGARWVDNSHQTVHLELNRPVRKSDIRSFMLTTSFGSDIFSDDWNLEAFQVTTGHEGIVIAESFPAAGQQYIYRFSGDERRQRHVIRVQ